MAKFSSKHRTFRRFYRSFLNDLKWFWEGEGAFIVFFVGLLLVVFCYALLYLSAIFSFNY